MKAYILLEDGTVVEGKSFGAQKTVLAELVFNTGMTGYQEILTDPSYAGQAVVMTYPLIGNYGVNSADVESVSVHAEGFVVYEYSDSPNNFKCEQTLSDYLKEKGVFAVSRVDTRMLTKKIRNFGTMKCLMTTQELNDNHKKLLSEYSIPNDLVQKVSRTSTETLTGKGKHIAVVDFGIKSGIVKNLETLGAKITLFPWNVSAQEILAVNPDAVLLSNGPGDPKDVTEGIKTAQDLLGKLPLFGICLGHQILCLALGGDTYKLKFGHRGSNHPVMNLRTNKVSITSQNHGYAVNSDILPDGVEVTHVNINDGTVEGFCHKGLKVNTVQYHPEAGPGPDDARYIFKDWLELLDKEYANA